MASAVKEGDQRTFLYKTWSNAPLSNVTEGTVHAPSSREALMDIVRNYGNITDLFAAEVREGGSLAATWSSPAARMLTELVDFVTIIPTLPTEPLITIIRE